jgi:hypothetical protein
MTDWKKINLLARAYQELQRTRVGFDLRTQKLEQAGLVGEGLLLKLDLTKYDKKTGATVRATKYEPIDKTKATEKKTAEFLEDLRKNDNIHHILSAHEKRLKKQEADMVKDAAEIFEKTDIWKWCLRTRGLGPVAGLTFMGFIDPSRSPTLSNLWSLAGLTPGSRPKRGQQGHSNLIMKSRMWLIAGNTIKAQDSYYSKIYNLKKEYFSQRPDLLVQKEGPDKIKGWKGKMHNYALRVLMKILISHAYEIIMNEYRGEGGRVNGEDYEGLTTEQRKQREKHIIYSDNYVPHRNPLPIKPEDPMEQTRVLESFAKTNAKLLGRLNELWNDTTDKDHVKYYDFMRHADLG